MSLALLDCSEGLLETALRLLQPFGLRGYAAPDHNALAFCRTQPCGLHSSISPLSRSKPIGYESLLSHRIVHLRQ